MPILVIVPMRGGSKTVPRKHLRPLAGRPLCHHLLSTLREVFPSDEIVVTTDDPEIAACAGVLDVTIGLRDEMDDTHTADRAIYEAMERYRTTDTNLVVSAQVDSPFLEAATIRLAVDRVRGGADTVIAVADDRHLRWTERDGNPIGPERLNRQQMPPAWRELGALTVTRPEFVTPHGRAGPKVVLLYLRDHEAVNIDTPADFGVAEWWCSRSTIVYHALGNAEHGMGHIWRGRVAQDWLPPGHTFTLQEYESGPPKCEVADVNVVDGWDTTQLDPWPRGTVTVEDHGPHIDMAGATINDLLPEERQTPGYFGPRYAMVPRSALWRKPVPIRRHLKSIAIVMGGNDAGGYAAGIRDAVRAAKPGWRVEIVTAPSPDALLDAVDGFDLAVVNAGRTVWDLGSIGMPMIAVARNNREQRHRITFESVGIPVCDVAAAETKVNQGINQLLSQSRRRAMQQRLLALDLTQSPRRFWKVVLDAAEA